MRAIFFSKMQILNSVYLFVLLAMPFTNQAQAKAHSLIAKHKTIILIHGLMRTPASMYFLNFYLKNEGYQTYTYDYPSAKNTIQEHGLLLNQYLKKFLKDHPNTQVYLITHSLGGIIARDGLARLNSEELKHIGGLIMLAPPNQGSVLAKFFTKIFPLTSYFIKPLTELSSEQNSYVHKVPIPKVKIGIIAGRYDAKVPPDSAHLEGQADPVVVNSTHTFIMNNAQTKLYIKHFLEKGSFD